MPAVPSERLVPALLLALGLLLLAWALRRAARSLRARSRARRALRGEERAEAILARYGYSVIGRQVTVSWPVWIDGEPIAFELRADCIVESGARRYVAEVKTGAVAPRLDTPATRRQLLEYRVAFDVDGVLLVDAEAGAVRRVDFALDRRTPRRLGVRAFVLGLAVGIAAGAIAVAWRQ